MNLKSHLDHIAKVSVTDALTYMERWNAEGFDPTALHITDRIALADAILARREPGDRSQYRDRLGPIVGLPVSNTLYLMTTVVHALRHPSESVRTAAAGAVEQFEADGRVYTAYGAVRKVLPSNRPGPPSITAAAEQRRVITQVVAQLTGLCGALNQIRELAPEITGEEAAQWVDGLRRNRRVIEQVINRIKEPNHE